ncbi:hypothetical protein Desaci_4123 [Desulfosporosinus acidiphilus SJ4]|uniref:HD domain-containing protein n=1 Tax=Desulfosporosinus acidiphilus (strain DSM 22704 / JCM 16185 / SJ4) TaxID=646529 RepID=I4DB11_DESAJ|nr:HD domain-containing protein [Desulfosporosinus acidiphilus]AFM42985.1 hypothetical protein Desaci_4123 [Desulfosporosinus acidiphilus SJ4]
MKTLGSVGTRSLLFGVHQFLWHPFTVWLAWRELYGPPSWKETICIVLHDIGYWHKKSMNGSDGVNHPEAGAELAGRLFGEECRQLVLGHSRSYAQSYNMKPNKLCWADKLSIKYEPWWLYLPRAWMSGELMEYRGMADQTGFINKRQPHREWLSRLKEQMIEQAYEEVELAGLMSGPECRYPYSINRSSEYM